MTLFGRWVLLLAVVSLFGCAAPQYQQPGKSKADVVAALGQPTARYPLPDALGAERLQYSQQPMGTLVHNLDFDAGDRLLRVQQTLDEGVLGHAITPGVTRVEELAPLIGPPAEKLRVRYFDGELWLWRYMGQNVRRMLHVFISPAGVVQNWGGVDIDLPDR